MPGRAARLDTLLYPGLYVIGDREQAGGLGHLDIARAAFEAGARVYQVREKSSISDASLVSEMRALVALAAEFQSLAVINDRVELAANVGAHAVHLGQEDMPIAEARRNLGMDVILGLSTHNEEQIEAAIDMTRDRDVRLDYISVGPIFGTTSKKNPEPTVGLELLIYGRARTTAPLVAIGGVHTDNIADVYGHGADVVAVISAAMGKTNIEIIKKVGRLVGPMKLMKKPPSPPMEIDPA